MSLLSLSVSSYLAWWWCVVSVEEVPFIWRAHLLMQGWWGSLVEATRQAGESTAHLSSSGSAPPPGAGSSGPFHLPYMGTCPPQWFPPCGRQPSGLQPCLYVCDLRCQYLFAINKVQQSLKNSALQSPQSIPFPFEFSSLSVSHVTRHQPSPHSADIDRVSVVCWVTYTRWNWTRIWPPQLAPSG